MPNDEMPSVSRMQEIRMSGLMRGEGRPMTPLLYSTGLDQVYLFKTA